jgi:tRNA(Ile)-lysidine synthase
MEDQSLHMNIRTFVQKHKLFGQRDTIIVAISGGMDSVVLTHLLYSIKQPMILAHCNFQLRGEESDRDEHFVRALAEKWELPLHVEKYDTKQFALENKLSIQVAARQLRYDFFERLCKQYAAPGKNVVIATAHHANDAVETMLMHLFRGTGIDGLRGIPVKNGSIIRPLLFATQEQIEAYAKDNELGWVEDSSNAKEDYTRNYVRHTVIPAIIEQFPNALGSMLGTMDKVNDAAALYHERIDLLLKKMVVKDGDMQKVPILKISKASQRNTIIWEWIKPYGFSEGQIGEVVKLFVADNGSYIASASHRILRNRAWLILSELGKLVGAPQVIEAFDSTNYISESKILKLGSPVPFTLDKPIPLLPDNEAWIDAAALRFPLILRPWKPGDYFYPLGMQKKKKVARFLIDKKVAPQDKENIWVLESDKRIVWVVGQRMDDRFKLTEMCKDVIKASIIFSKNYKK